MTSSDTLHCRPPGRFDFLKASSTTQWKQMCLAEEAVARHYSGAQKKPVSEAMDLDFIVKF